MTTTTTEKLTCSNVGGYSHARIVLSLIEGNSPTAVALAMGYMVTRDGRRIVFSDHYGNRLADAPRVVARSHNRAGRCTGLTVQYSDGSRLRFTWSEAHGPRYAVQVAP